MIIYWSLIIFMAITILLVIGFCLSRKKNQDQEDEKPFGDQTTRRILSKHGMEKESHHKKIKNEKK